MKMNWWVEKREWKSSQREWREMRIFVFKEILAPSDLYEIYNNLPMEFAITIPFPRVFWSYFVLRMSTY